MKNLTIPIDHLVMLAELDDKDAGQMAKAIAQYANKGIAPSFSNSGKHPTAILVFSEEVLTFAPKNLKIGSMAVNVKGWPISLEHSEPQQILGL